MFNFLLMASDTNAVRDILYSDAFQGSTDAVQQISAVVESGFSFFISLVAFFMISVALLRNVLAGAYCAFPKFWDQVDTAHKENADKAFFASVTGIKDSYKNVSMSTLKTALFRIIPNIKCLTEFADAEQDAKNYFIKAIPQMLGVVILGVFIYNGYWRDASAQVATFGSELFKRTLLSWDITDAFDRVINTSGMPVFNTDSAVTDEGKNQNRVTKDIYRAILGKFSDIASADDKATLASSIDEAVTSIFSQASTAVSGLPTNAKSEDETNWFGNNARHNFSYDVQIVKSSTAAAEPSASNDKNTVVAQYKIGLTINGDQINSGSDNIPNLTFNSKKTEVAEQDWTVLVSLWSTLNNDTASGNVVAVELTLPNNEFTTGEPQGLMGISNGFTVTDSAGKTVHYAFTSQASTYFGTFKPDSNPSPGDATGSITLKTRDAKYNLVVKKITITEGGSFGISLTSESAEKFELNAADKGYMVTPKTSSGNNSQPSES